MNHAELAFNSLITLAQDAGAAPTKAVGMPGATPSAAAAPAGAATPSGAAQSSGGSTLPLIMLLAFGVMFIPMILSGRKEQKKRAELMSSLRKGDKVQTSGGIIGTIAELGQDDVVLRVEEGRIRFAKSAVSGVIRSNGAKTDAQIAEPKADAKSDSKSESKAVGV
jgi:preprotein translocase subunit YajC